jgi:DNA-binding GntR family transcriptional regulator
MTPPRGRRPAAKDRAYAHVKERILEGIYPGGELLSEGEVAAQLDMSRTPVREAFLLLEAEGLMRLYPKRGALVVPVSAGEINEVLETRLVIERHCAEQVARRGPEVREELLVQLRTFLGDQERHIARGNRIGFVEADRLFHRAIVSADGNSILVRLHDSLRERQRRMGATIVARDPAVQRRYLGEHRAIVEALEDGGDAGRLLAEHIEGARRDYAPAGLLPEG